MWVQPTEIKSPIDLNSLDISKQSKGYAIYKHLDFTIKISKKGFLNIYIKRNILQTLNEIHIIIDEFYEYVAKKSGITITKYTTKINNVNGGFSHNFSTLKLIELRQLFESNLSTIDLREELHFKVHCEHGTLMLLQNRGTFIAKNLESYSKLVSYIKTGYLA